MLDLQATLESIRKNFLADSAALDTIEVIEHLRNRYLSRKNGELSTVLRQLKNITDPNEQREIGNLANSIKQEIQEALSTAEQHLSKSVTDSQTFDPTLPAKLPSIGHMHPLRKVQAELVDIFYSMGFMVVEGNELETEDYCFEYLNIPPTHPARDLQDTFFIKNPSRPEHNQQVMRTHTSNMQVRMMQQHTPPLRVIVPGRTFRNEATDASHDHTFYQMEGFVVDTNISIANLTYVLKMAMSKILKQTVQIRLRPGYFPYVEPGFEADCSCVHCDAKGCAVCKYTGWIEMLGCGMIHPKVFESAGYPAGKYTGFAFGVGISRLAMMKYGIKDNRLFMAGDLRFNEQF